MGRSHPRPASLTPLAVALVVSVTVILLAFWSDVFVGLEGTFSAREAALLQDPSHPVLSRVVIVAYDEASMSELGRLQDWSRTLHARLVERLSEAGAVLVGYDTVFSSPSSDPEADAALVRTSGAAGNVILAAYGETAGRQPTNRPLRIAGDLVEPFPGLRTAGTGLINVIPDADLVVRRMPLFLEHSSGRRLTLAAEMARQLGLDLSSVRTDRSGRYLVRFFGNYGTFRHYSFSAVVSGAIAPETFKGKVVLVGPTAAVLQDDVATPLGIMQGVELHANALATLLAGESAVPAGPLAIVGATFLLGLSSGWFSGRLGPLGGLTVVLLIGVAYFFWAVGSNVLLGYAWEMAPPIVAAVSSFLGVAGLKYIGERRSRQRITSLFGRFVDERVVRELIAAGTDARAGGERRQVTVLFMDVVGFTPLAEGLAPEEVVSRLNQVFTVASEVIFHYEGTLDKFMGDCVMAFWNAPLPVEDHAYKAVRAASEIASAAERDHGITFRVGISTGDAVVGNIGSARRLEFTVIGDAVNLASRLQTLARPGSITISEATYEALDGRVSAISLGELAIKGKREKVRAYRLDPHTPATGTILE